ncbi:phage major capsid protein [Patescibacteria group bacterium]|nr:phage major capsid protein [Patescibacteria group bacterium]MBU1999474.1 phage major capsid protein [Candidatus Omnitrophota bacterium]
MDIEVKKQDSDKVIKDASDIVKTQEMTPEVKGIVKAMVEEALSKRIKEDEEKRLAAVRKTAPVDESDQFSINDNGRMGTLIYKRSADPNVIEMQKKSDELYLLSTITKQHPGKTKLWNEFRHFQSELSKAMAAGTAGSGAEWIPTGFSADLIDRVRLELVVASIHDRISMPTNPFKSPIVSSDATGYLIPESAADPESVTRIVSSAPGTRQVTFTAKKLAGRVIFSEEMSEDSIIPVLPMLRQNVITALATSQETATINGDTAGVHQDSDVTNTKDSRKAWDGYRKLALAGAKIDFAGTISQAKLRTVRKVLGKYGVTPSKLCWIVGIAGFTHLLNLNQASNSQDVLITPDKYGASIADRLPGEVGRIDNIPVIISEHVREDLNETGVYGGLVNTKTIILLANRPSFQYGDRRVITIKIAEDIQTDQTILVATQRIDFEAVPNPATETIVGVGYNIAS